MVRGWVLLVWGGFGFGVYDCLFWVIVIVSLGAFACGVWVWFGLGWVLEFAFFGMCLGWVWWLGGCCGFRLGLLIIYT